MKKSTHIQLQKDNAQSVKLEVCRLIGCTELQYCEFQYKVGKQFLQSYMSRFPVMIDELVENKMFWSWWRNAWMQRDDVFIVNVKHFNRLDILRLYDGLHDYKALINELFPDFKLILKHSNETICR